MFLSLVMLPDANNEETLPTRHAKQTLQQFSKFESFKNIFLKVSLTECKLFLSMLLFVLFY